MELFFIAVVAKISSVVSRFFSLGAGVTWPGEICLKIDNNLINKLSRQVKKGIIIVAGTNGKTTTVSMIHHLLSAPATKVIHNRSGANLRNGVAGTLILNTDFWGKLQADYAIFEIDEATLPLILKDLTPKIIVLLNLFRDQLDRYGEVDMIAMIWSRALREVGKVSQVSRVSREDGETILIANADDPLIASIGEKFKHRKYYFGLDDEKYDLGNLPHATDSIYCLNCGKKLIYNAVYLSHFGDWRCDNCSLKRPKINLSQTNSPLLGVYNIYNTQAALLTASVLGINNSVSSQKLKNFKPVFGRQETFNVHGKKIQLFLSKNPTGFNESLRTVMEKDDLTTILLVLNDRIPDGTDVSWIWDVDFEKIVDKAKTIIVSGDRVYDMGLRIKYSFKSQKSKVKSQKYNLKLKIIINLREALNESLKDVKYGETLYVFPTYSAMLEVRKILTGRKIL